MLKIFKNSRNLTARSWRVLNHFSKAMIGLCIRVSVDTKSIKLPVDEMACKIIETLGSECLPP